MKIGIIKEGKTPPDKRVPLTPQQCKFLITSFPGTEVVVQKSRIRAIPDEEYENHGIPLVDDLSDCDTIMGVKEVPIQQLIPNKTYFFFSHTIKEQPYNRDLLQAIIDRNINLIDYETIVNTKGVRMIGFGRYAGIVGCFNGMLAYGMKTNSFNLKRANQCKDRNELHQELRKVQLPKNFKIAITGLGRVAKGAIEILELLQINKVSSKDFISKNYDHPVYTQLNVEDYNKRTDGADFNRFDFYKNPKPYQSTFPRFLAVADMYISCHYWHADSPFLFTKDDLKSNDLRTKIVADISCDIDGPVACTIRPSTIADPLYGYDPITEREVDFMDNNAIGVMAVDNLPCELPADASADFGKELIKKVLPLYLGKDPDGIIENSIIAKNGELTKRFRYLQSYLDGN